MSEALKFFTDTHFEVVEIKGVYAVPAFQLVQKLLLAYIHLPQYVINGITLNTFSNDFQELSESQKLSILKSAIGQLQLDPESELMPVLRFVKDKNNVLLSTAGAHRNYSPVELLDAVLHVCLEVLKKKYFY